jgi:hypothetical protein
MKRSWRTAGWVCAALLGTGTASAQSAVVHDSVVGQSPSYFGVTVGGDSSADLSAAKEAGILLLRDWLEGIPESTTAFDGHTAAEVKANPDVLDWTSVDRTFGRMRNHLTWARDVSGVFLPAFKWRRHLTTSGACQTMGEYQFNVGDAADENVFWTYVFALAYWANVKNNLHLTHLEVSNEPDNCTNTSANMPVFAGGHDRMVQIAKDALTYVNEQVVSPSVPAKIVGPGVLSPGADHLRRAMADPATQGAIDYPSFHSYWAEHWYDEFQTGAGVVNATKTGKRSWVTEWGQWWYDGGYDNSVVVNAMAVAIASMGLLSIDAHILYGIANNPGWSQGIISDGRKTRMYWEHKMLGRALLVQKDMLDTVSTGDAWVYATRDAEDLYLIALNGGAAQNLSIDLKAFPAAEGAAVDVYCVGVGTTEVAEPATVVKAGGFQLSMKDDTHYVAVVHGAGGVRDGGVIPAPGTGTPAAEAGRVAADAKGTGPTTERDGGAARADGAIAQPSAEEEDTSDTPAGAQASCSYGGRAAGRWWPLVAATVALLTFRLRPTRTRAGTGGGASMLDASPNERSGR